MAVLLFEGADVPISPGIAERLARLGVTRVELLGDRETLAVVLEGWAFDADSGAEAAAIVAPGCDARLLVPVMRVAVGRASSD